MKTTVVMATYNGEKYIIEQLESIKNQSCIPDEVIIRDDCSNDNTVKIIKEFIETNNLNENWKVTINERNLGYADNFRTATMSATGDLIFFSDQDDIWKLDKIEITKRMFKEHKEMLLLTSHFETFIGSVK